jgi:hypothetical protein
MKRAVLGSFQQKNKKKMLQLGIIQRSLLTPNATFEEASLTGAIFGIFSCFCLLTVFSTNRSVVTINSITFLAKKW